MEKKISKSQKSNQNQQNQATQNLATENPAAENNEILSAPAVETCVSEIKAPKGKKKFWKKCVVAGVLAAVVVVGGVFVVGGMKKDKIYDSAVKNVAEARYFMKDAEAAGLTVQFYVGKREEPYSQNGVASKNVVPFAIVNVNADSSFKTVEQIDGTVKIANQQFPITLLKNPYNPLNFTYDIVESLNNKTVSAADAVEVSLQVSGGTKTVALNNVFDGETISWDQALKAATEKLKDQLSGQKFETYVTIINNVAKDSGAYWYVQFVTDEGKTHYAVVSKDGTVIA
jgi:hypothetical protein